MFGTASQGPGAIYPLKSAGMKNFSNLLGVEVSPCASRSYKPAWCKGRAADLWENVGGGGGGEYEGGAPLCWPSRLSIRLSILIDGLTQHLQTLEAVKELS